MKKLLLSLCVMAFVFPETEFFLESYSPNIFYNYKSKSKLSINDDSNDFYSNPKSLSVDEGKIVSVLANNNNLAFYLNNNNNDDDDDEKVYLLKTNISDGKTSKVDFFNTNDKIESILSFASVLYIFLDKDIYSFDFKNVHQDIFNTSVKKDWFNGGITNETADKYGITITKNNYKKFFNLEDSSVVSTYSDIKIISGTNQILVGYVSKSRIAKTYTIDDTGVNENQNLSVTSSHSPKQFKEINGVVDVKNDKEVTTVYFIVRDDDNVPYLYSPKTDSGLMRITLNIDGQVEVLEKDESVIFFGLGDKKIISYKGALLVWNHYSDNTQAEILNNKFQISFSSETIIFNQSNVDISYISSGASEKEGNEIYNSLYFGTNHGQYKFLYKLNGNEPFTINDIHNEIIKISEINIDFSSETALFASGLGVYYVYDPKNKNLCIIHHKVNLKESYDLNDYFKENKGVNNQMKVDYIFKAIYNSLSEKEQQYFLESDIATLLDPDGKGPDAISGLDNFKIEDGVQSKFTLSLPKSALWINDLTKITFTVGHDKSIENIKSALDGLVIDVKKDLSISSELPEFRDIIKNSIIDKLKAQPKVAQYSSQIELEDFNLSDENDVILWEPQSTKIIYTLSISGTEDLIENLSATMQNVDKGEMKVDKTSRTIGHGKAATFEIKNYRFIKKYLDFKGEEIDYSIEATGTPAENDDKKNINLYEDVSISNWSDFASINIDSDKGIISVKSFDKEKSYEGDLNLRISLKNPEFIKGEPITLVVKIPLIDPVTPGINWAMIGGIIGAVLGAGLLGFLIFAFIKWWWPLIAAKSSGGKRKKIKSYGRLPQDLANTNARHNGGEVKKVLTRYDKGFVRSGVFEREVDANDTKFKNENYETSFLGYDVEEDAVVNNWAIDKEEGVAKKPRIAFEKKEKTMRHEQSIAKKMTKLKNKKNKH